MAFLPSQEIINKFLTGRTKSNRANHVPNLLIKERTLRSNLRCFILSVNIFSIFRGSGNSICVARGPFSESRSRFLPVNWTKGCFHREAANGRWGGVEVGNYRCYGVILGNKQGEHYTRDSRSYWLSDASLGALTPVLLFAWGRWWNFHRCAATGGNDRYVFCQLWTMSTENSESSSRGLCPSAQRDTFF